VVNSSLLANQQFHHHQRHLSRPASAANYNERQLLQLFSHVDHRAPPGRLPDQTSKADMELGHILWGSDPVTRESSDPETQLTRWPCSIMNSKCRLMLQTNVCNEQEVCQFLSLFGVCTLLESKILKIIYKMSVNISMTVGRIFTKIYISLYLYLGLFSKTGKTRVSHRVKMMTRWPGRERWPKWPTDPVTQWPSSMSDLKTF